MSYVKISDQQFIELYEKSGDSPLGFMHICFETSDIESLRSAYLKVDSVQQRSRNFAPATCSSPCTIPPASSSSTRSIYQVLYILWTGEKHIGKNRISERWWDPQLLPRISQPRTSTMRRISVSDPWIQLPSDFAYPAIRASGSACCRSGRSAEDRLSSDQAQARAKQPAPKRNEV